MDTLSGLLTEELKRAFISAGYDETYAKASVSNRPDLCEYQCSGALSAAKRYHKSPIIIAQDIVKELQDSEYFENASAVKPGFINLNISPVFAAKFLNSMAVDENLGFEKSKTPKTVIVDYGGPNVAKPLHVGHLRAAIIGESVKRIARFKGNRAIGDIHMGDWGFQMGLIITELKARRPDLPYFDENFTGEYPQEAPFTLDGLAEIYPAASAYAKTHPDYHNEALKATFLLQNGNRGYTALWKHIMRLSVADLKKNYKALGVEFDLWKGESDVQKYIPGMVSALKEKGFAHIDDGALVVDVAREDDTRKVPPFMLLKSDGASLYGTTDLATLLEREKLYKPDEVIYVVDKRQEMHFEQLFRCAKKTGTVRPEVSLKFLGFGTMNGKDGKPFKTREGGVKRLSELIEEINAEMYKKIIENGTVPREEAEETAKTVALAALKYGDLENQASKDYIFDVDRFTSFEGNTGPYILYTIVRIKSILNKYIASGGNCGGLSIICGEGGREKPLMLKAAKFAEAVDSAYEEIAPHRICAYIYELADEFNKFYHETKILSCEDEKLRDGYIALIGLVKRVLEVCVGLLGFEAPERM